MGGTFPALIWASVISAWEDIAAERAAETAAERAARAEGKDTAKAAKKKPTCAGNRSRTGRTGRSRPGSPKPAPEPEAAPEARRPKPRLGGSGGRPPESGGTGGRHHRRGYAARGRGRETKRVAGGAEAPGALDGLGDPDPGAGEDLRPGAVLGRQDQERVAGEVGAVLAEADAERLGQLARARAELVGRVAAAAPGAHLLEPARRLEGADQHRRRLALGLGDEVEQAVDPVGEVDVGAARRAEEGLGPRREAGEGVAGGVVALVALGLDDRAAAPLVEEPAADQLARDLVDGALEEGRVQALARRPLPRSFLLFGRPAPGPRRASRGRARAAAPAAPSRCRPRSASTPASCCARAPRSRSRRAARGALAQLLEASARRGSCPARPRRGPGRRRSRGPRGTGRPCGRAGRRSRSPPASRRRRRPRAARGRTRSRPASPRPRRGTTRPCRSRRRAAPCPPACPCRRSAAGRASCPAGRA